MSKKVVVIGGGISGLAISALLGQKGFEVTLLEKNSQIGGKARVFKQKGFTFDMGPSWYLMPEVYEYYFSQFDQKPNDYYSLQKLNPSYRVFTSNLQIDISSNLSQNLKTFNKFEKSGGMKLKKYLIELESYYKVALLDFIYKEPNHKIYYKALKITRLFQNFERYLSQKFQSNIAKTLLSFHPNFLGNTPKNLPAFYAILNYTDLAKGVWYPENGMTSLVDTLLKLCQKYTVNIKLNEPVIKITTRNQKILSVKTQNKTYTAHIFINSTDLAYFETKLIPENLKSYSESYWHKKTFGPKLKIYFLGLNRKITKVLHHNLILEDDVSFYLCCPTKTNHDLSPPDSEILQILCPANLSFKKILNKIEKITSKRIADSIIFKKIYTPKDFETDYNSYQGSALGLNHTFFQSGPFRPGHKSKKINNLYYCGQYTSPGIGVPMVLMSAVQTVDLIQKEWID